VITVTHKPSPKPKPPAHLERAKPGRHVEADPIADVVPLRVDVHGELGAIASNVRDDRRLALAAAALLVAVAAAASGAGLAFVARRTA
jgi:hypothetical protein